MKKKTSFVFVFLFCMLFSQMLFGERIPSHLLCENKTNPIGIDSQKPRFSWWVNDEGKDVVQTAYQIVVYNPSTEMVWDSGVVHSDQSIYVAYKGSKLRSQMRYHWKVRTWNDDEDPSPWSELQFFETALMGQDEWKAKWIAHPKRYTARSVPPVYLRKQFSIQNKVQKARLYVSARGIFEGKLNGTRVGEDFFAPGWTDYTLRNQYMTYDVSDLIQEGENSIGFILADGWNTGYLKWEKSKNWYAKDNSIIAQLVVETVEGKKYRIATDKDWKVATGPILESDFYNGEKYDARAEFGNWTHSEFDDSDWLNPVINREPTGTLMAKVVEPVRKQKVLSAKSCKRLENGTWVFDFGQNMVGWAKVRLAARMGETVTLHFAEMINSDGSLYRTNYRSAESTDRYTFKDDQSVEWEPKFTFHGFRYVGVSGIEGPIDKDSVKAVVLHTDAASTGEFSCSNQLINRLQSNIVWGQKGNYLEVPTDCPQRDERLGWTGDAQVFVRTATFNMNIVPFFEKWLADMRDAQLENGIVPFIVPSLGEKGASPAWSDAAVICPWVIYERYGDKKILADNFEMMCRWVDYQASTSDNYIWPGKAHGEWQGFGDWLAIDAPEPGTAPTPKDLIGTAHFRNGSLLLSKVAEVLGKTKEAAYYFDLSSKVKQAFLDKFVDESGRLNTETQTGYNLAIAFDLMEAEKTGIAINRLVADIESRGWHLSSGFVGTGLLMPVLSQANRNDVAYNVLLQETYPGWLYSIKQGATTMWERWNSYSHKDGFGDAGMNSFNHYAYGAVGEWIYSVVGGIDSLEAGFKKILIQPQPGGGLTWAKASLKSPYGLISSSWEIDEKGFHLDVTIPVNTTAKIVLPGGSIHEVGSGSYSLSE